MISTSIYYLLQWILENTEFPFTGGDMISGIFILLLTIIIIFGLTIFGFIKIDKILIKEKLNIKKGILYLIIGVITSLGIMNLLVGLNIIKSDFPLLLFILIVMTIPVLCLNYGLRIGKNYA